MLAHIRHKTSDFLHWLEGRVQVDIAYLASGGFWLASGQFVASLSTFILAVAFAHFVPKDSYGTYKYILSVFGVLAITTLPGVNTYMAQAIARGAEGTLLAGVRARMLWGIVGVTGSLVTAVYYTLHGNMMLAGAFAVMASFIPFFDTLGLYNTFLQSTKRFRVSIQYFIIVQLLSVFTLILAMYFSYNLFVLIVAYFVPTTLLRGYFFLRTLSRFHPNSVRDQNAIRYGMHLSVVGVLGQIVGYIDTILLFHFLGPAQVAIYSFALAPSEQLRVLFSKNISPLVLPKLANRSFLEINETLPRRMMFLTTLGVGLALFYALFAPILFQIFFPQYFESVKYSILLTMLIIITVPMSYLSTAILARLHTIPPKWIYWAAVPDALHILTLIVLLPAFGIIGIIASKVIESSSALCISIMQWYLLSKRNRYETTASEHGPRS